VTLQEAAEVRAVDTGHARGLCDRAAGALHDLLQIVPFERGAHPLLGLDERELLVAFELDLRDRHRAADLAIGIGPEDSGPIPKQELAVLDDSTVDRTALEGRRTP